ncbi:MAG: hypothetical protein QMC85_04735 [Methanocellales archaeon]|nr:hypothetical protein [Methanocellales archaeon]
MPTLKDYNQITVIQRNKNTGCIPASIEWLIRYHNVDLGQPLDDFQEKVNCGSQSSFGSVSQKVKEVYGFEKIKYKGFEPKEKCEAIKELINKGSGCVVSIAIGPDKGWHVTPAVKYDNERLTILDLTKPIGSQEVTYIWQEIIDRQRQFEGGNDILWLDL